GMEPENREFQGLREQAQQDLANIRKVQELFPRGEQHKRLQGAWSVWGCSDDLLTVEPQHAGALAMKRQAGEALERQRKIEGLLTAARTHAQAQQYEACYRVSTEGLGLDPGNVELRKLQTSAHEVLEKRRLEQERR